MKIRIDKNKKENLVKKLRYICNERLKIHYYFRLIFLLTLSSLLLFSAVSAFAAISTPEKRYEIAPLYSYIQTGKFNYKVYLENSTIYNGAEYLLPGQTTIFTRLVKSINGSFKYKIFVGCNANISGKYSMNSRINTNLWTKNIEIIDETDFNSTNNSITISERFPIDLQYYQDLIDEIDGETGIVSKDHSITFQFNCRFTACTKNDTIRDTFQQQMYLNLNQRTLDFSEGLSNEKFGAKNKRILNLDNEIIKQRGIWKSICYLFLILIALTVILTRGDKKHLDQIERKARKIQKKYGELLVNIKKQPKRSVNFDVLYTGTFDDLIKISEEIGKPIFHYKTGNHSHTYHVLDSIHQYQFVLS